MKQSYLIQRLNKPHGNTKFDAVSEIFSFGGGLRNGGLTDEAMSLLRNIFSFDYMGAAEFEFGALPNALSKIAKNTDKYQTFAISMKTKEGNEKDVYIICARTDSDEIISLLKLFAKNEYGRKTPHTKERVGLQDAINEAKYSRAKGWIELDNGYFFFIDKNMFESTAKLFGIKYDLSDPA